MKEEKCVIQRACRILRRLSQTTDWRPRCPRPGSAHRPSREDTDTFLQTHKASLTHNAAHVIFLPVCIYECETLSRAACVFWCVSAGCEGWSVKWSVRSLLHNPPSCSPAKAPKTKQRPHCASLSKTKKKMKWELPRRLFLIILTRERHFSFSKHLLGINARKTTQH